MIPNGEIILCLGNLLLSHFSQNFGVLSFFTKKKTRHFYLVPTHIFYEEKRQYMSHEMTKLTKCVQITDRPGHQPSYSGTSVSFSR